MTVTQLRELLANVDGSVQVAVRACGEDYDYEDATIATQMFMEFLADDGESIEKRVRFVIE